MHYIKPVALFILLLLIDQVLTGQVFQYFTLDSILNSNSEQFSISFNGKNDNIKKAVLGPYKVTNVEIIDSGRYTTKTKLGNEISMSSEQLLGEYKIRKFESHAYYRLGVGKDADSTTCFFSYFSSYNKKTETLLSAILSNKEEGAEVQYSDMNRLLQGNITILNNQDIWRFMLHYPPSNPGLINKSIEGYLTDGRDSLRIDFLYVDIIKVSKKDPSQEKHIMRSPRGYTLVDFENRQVAALIFRQTSSYFGAKKLGNYTNDSLGIIGNDNRKSAKLAIVTLFAIMLGIQ